MGRKKKIQAIVNDDFVDSLQFRVASLEEKIVKLEQLIEFWHGRVPIKYRKAFPKEGESPYFTHEKFKPKYPKVLGLDHIRECVELDMPSDPKEYKEALARMKGYALDKVLSKRDPSAASSTPSASSD